MKWFSVAARLSVVAVCFSHFILVGSAPAGVVPGAVHVYDASIDTDGDYVWEDTGTLGNRDLTLLATGGTSADSAIRVPVSSNTLIDFAYRFDGIDDYGEIESENRSGNHDATFDLWFKPDGFQPSSPDEMGLARTIYENGNAPRGLTIGLNGDMLVFAYAASPNFGYLMYDLDQDDNGVPDNPDFIHVALTINDASNDADPNADWIRLYVDGGNEQELATPGFMDWSSKDLSGVARNVTQDGGGQDSTDPLGIVWGGHFAGDVAVLREYRFTFTAEQVLQNYLAMLPDLIPGDGNGDGKVDGLDYLIWAENFDDNPANDPPGSPYNGDFDGDGKVDGLDYVVWANHFEQGRGNGGS
ncbi:MAG: dockerin type I domain-containing protein [Pirellulales bacterium]